MNMKTLIIGLLASLLYLAPAIGQITDDDFDHPRLGQVQAQRVAYITQRLSLTPQESATFWALVNEYELKQQKIKEQYKPTLRIEQMTETQAEQYIQQSMDKDAKLLDLKKTYFEKFKEVVPASKIALFPVADREFKREVLKRAMENRMRNRPGRN